jgi:hypothetical protein
MHLLGWVAMELDNLAPDILWRYYQRGYHSLVRSGLYFRQVLRPALSHVYFQRAVPLLVEYARANRGLGDLPPGFGDQLEACPLTPRDLLHLDYAICLGYAEAQGTDPKALATLPLLDWPGPGGSNGLFIAADAPAIIGALERMGLEKLMNDLEIEEEDEGVEDDGDEESKPPYDL